MLTIDLNCDMGEGAGNDELIMPFISSANIACGYHAGDDAIMRETIILAAANNVSIGAHVSYNDRQNFGRSEMRLSSKEIYDLVTKQLGLINDIAVDLGNKLNHVKPHGALYNMSARDTSIAKAIADAVNDFDSTLVLYGLSGSYSVHEAQKTGLKTCSEVFADRSYDDQGKLVARSHPLALIEDEELVAKQVMRMVKEGTIITLSGGSIEVAAETICIHGDGKNAVRFASTIFQQLKQNNIVIKAV
jgi:UPF0271 protein